MSDVRFAKLAPKVGFSRQVKELKQSCQTGEPHLSLEPLDSKKVKNGRTHAF